MKLYQYTSISTPERKEWLKSILLDNLIYFRSRSALNDPLELRPFVLTGTDASEARRYVRKLSEKYFPDMSPAKRLIHINQGIQRIRKSPNTQERAMHELLNLLGVLSFSESPTINLLWSHYANGHKGVVVEFCSEVGIFAAARKVTYIEGRPSVNIAIDNPEYLIRNAVFTKGLEWAYEKEWRIISRWKGVNPNIMPGSINGELYDFIQNQNGPSYYSFNPAAIKSVILGTEMPPEDYLWLTNIINKREEKMTIMKAKRTDDGSIVIT